MSPIRNKGIWLIIILFFIKTMMVFFTNLDHSGDGWGYACEILKHNFLSGHHLLYNLTGYLWLNLFFWLPIEPIKLLSWMNVVISCLTLFIFYKWLINQKLTDEFALSILLLLASCFGFYRYSIENETYILPLFLGIISIYYLESTKHSSVAWIAASLACLFHQIYIFWLIPILIKDFLKYRKSTHIIGAITIVTLPYFSASFYYKKKILSIVFQDFNNGLVNNYFNIKNVFIGAVNLIRSVFEIHGRIWLLFKNEALFIVAALFLLTFLAINTYKLLDNIRLSRLKINVSIFKLVEFWIFISTIIFAFWSNGNAEFMVSLPLLITLIAIKQFIKNINIDTKSSKYYMIIGLLLFTWNSLFYVIPICNSSLNSSNKDKVKRIENQIHNQQSTFNFTTNKYATPRYNNANILELDTTTQSTTKKTIQDTFVFISLEAATLHNCKEYFNIISNEKKQDLIIFLFPNDTAQLMEYGHLPIYTDLQSDKTIRRASITMLTKLNAMKFKPIDSMVSKTGVYRISYCERM